ncbi:glycerate kinase [Rhodococcus sp. 06-412-2C]|uniref:glycerate kinase n=1 Tax=unclassified Rhodococcus (in: high G+C Gram-positive bacteria) TaxID=192944 RepID=UPI000B9C27EB|nr:MULTISPECIES: glycerate kinase [unclassified Rhodococcus (in: high G+C Gram-positive bacteria)]OZC90321.1 glycerate kinase [Rhodococcus sp. 06-412-2B]OZC90395.1 glycerate kinase [Rhodococcus sp. 06-412-2B]OZC93096.1 glycerate kinase [Rhodococcus sp. 06-412-2C]
MTRILLAPDKFKGSLSAAEVARALAEGLVAVDPSLVTVCLPVADGGDGTVDAAVTAGWDRVAVTCSGPTGEVVDTSYARRGDTAVVELASAVGLELLPGGRSDALGASTFGLGTVIAHALEAGAARIVVGLGGSASTDGGAGMLTALGARVLDADGSDVARGGGALRGAVQLDVSGLVPSARNAVFELACDVDNPLLGRTGAAAVYGPQKGAGPQELLYLEHGMRQWAHLVRNAIGRDVSGLAGTGAAGGTAFGAIAVLGAVAKPGIETVLELIDFAGALAGADLVVTGEGSLDEQSLYGKAPIGVAHAAREAGVPVITVAGRSVIGLDRLRTHGVVASYALADLEPDPRISMRDAATLLRDVGRTIATTLSPVSEGIS